MVAAVVVVQVADHHVGDAVGRDADRRQPLAHRPRDAPAALGGHGGIEAGVEHPGLAGALDHPDEVGQRLEDVVRVAEDVVLVGLAVVVRVAHRIDLVDVLHHLKTRPRVSGPSQITIAAMPGQHHGHAHGVDHDEALVVQEPEHGRHRGADGRRGVVAEARADAAHLGGERFVAVGGRHAPDAHAEEAHHQRAQAEQQRLGARADRAAATRCRGSR